MPKETAPCASCDTPTSSAKGFCTNCQKASASGRPDFGEHADLASAYERHRRQVDAAGLSSEGRSRAVSKLNNFYGMKVSKRTPSRAFYAHPELNEQAELMHEMRYRQGVSDWKPSWAKW